MLWVTIGQRLTEELTYTHYSTRHADLHIKQADWLIRLLSGGRFNVEEKNPWRLYVHVRKKQALERASRLRGLASVFHVVALTMCTFVLMYVHYQILLSICRWQSCSVMDAQLLYIHRASTTVRRAARQQQQIKYRDAWWTSQYTTCITVLILRCHLRARHSVHLSTDMVYSM